MTNKLKKLVDKLEDSIDENSCDVWMHDLSDTAHATIPNAVDYRYEYGEVKYDGFYKDFLALKEEIYKLNNKEITK